MTGLILATVAAVAIIIVVHELALRGVMFLTRAQDVPTKIVSSRAWARALAFRFRMGERSPAFVRFVLKRLEPHPPAGLMLTLVVLAALYLAGIFSGIAEDVLEADGIIRIDNAVNAAFDQWRSEAVISAFLWITAFGSSPAVVAAVIIATGFFWAGRRFHMILPLWVTCLGAVITTSVGKFLIGRHRPEMAVDATITSSSFPSGHATAAMAVYGFIAYAIARVLPGAREQFEVGYWTAVLILLVGFSRIVLGMHYVTDVVGGFIVGGLWLLMGFTIAEWNRVDRAGGVPRP